MKYRLKNGEGQAFYQIGVHDKGHVIGLTEEEVREDLSVLYFMAQNLSYKMAIV
jgi:elongation factor 1-alpha